MACLYANNNKTLIDKLNSLYEEYGYYYDKVVSYSLNPLTGSEEISKIMNSLRNNRQTQLGGYKISKVEDYLKDIEGFTKSNVLRYIFEDGSFIAIRPSGTEPKYKIYYSLVEKNKEEAINKFNSLQASLNEIIKKA